MQRIVKPDYVDPVQFGGGQSLNFRPPMLFREVTARAFPLKANIARLAEFVDQYLNMDVPDEIVHYTPALPYVYFMALNYGGMSATTLDAQRLGWVAQHEAFFLIPLQRWRREHGKMVFQGWTSATPFIFVDDPLSMITGREVFGWPKALAEIEADKPEWTTHPRAPTRLFTMSADVFPHVYAGEQEPRRKLVTIDRDTVASYAEYPLNYKCPWSITSVIPNMYATSMSLMEEAAEYAANLRLRGFPDFRTSDALFEMAREGVALYGQMLAGLSPISLPGVGDPMSGTNARAQLMEDLPRYFSSTINLKQFRDPGRIDRACYSALVESAMGVDRLNQIGLLGDWDLLRGDASGGYSISIARYRAEPIIETLGIEVPNLYENAQEGDTVTLRPRFPFWMDVDLYYGAGDVICSRTPDVCDGDWIEEWSAEGVSGRHRVGRSHQRTPRRAAPANAYNTALGAATLPILGPMHFPDLTLQVYPLLADRAKLQAFLDACWKQLFDGAEANATLSFELASDYVYLTVATVGDAHGRMWSQSENIGWWAEREVAFAIPVRWRRNGELMGLALVEPLVFADKPRAVVTYREVNGRNAFHASIESPPDAFAAPGGPGAARKLLRVATESFVEIGFGLESKTLPLMEIDEGLPLEPSDLPSWRAVAGNWGRALSDDLQRKARAWRENTAGIEDVQALALECLVRRAPLPRLTLKQYRDAAEFDQACYQAVVETERRIDRIHALGEIDRAPHIALHRRANYPLVDMLGLKVKHSVSEESVVDYLEPVRPFWMRVALTESLGRIVATADPRRAPESSAASPRRWTFRDPHPPAGYFGQNGDTNVGAGLVRALREGDRQHLGERVQILSRRALTKELHALGGMASSLAGAAAPKLSGRLAAALAPNAPTGAFAALLAAEPHEALEEHARALRAALPNWSPPASRTLRARELERLAGWALEFEGHTAGAREARLAKLDPATRRRAEAIVAAFVEPADAPDAELRAAGAASLYATFAACHGAPAPGGPPADLAGTAAPATSALLDLVKRVEHWIVSAANWRLTIPEAAERALRRLRLKRFVAEYDFDADRMACLNASFDPGAWSALRALAKVAEGASFAQAQRRHDAAKASGDPSPPFDPAAALGLVAETFAGDVEDWTEPARFLPMTRGEAAKAVEGLEDLQLVIESILDDRWAAPGPVRSGPRARIPAACVGPLGAEATTWAQPNGLARLLQTGAPPVFVVVADAP